MSLEGERAKAEEEEIQFSSPLPEVQGHPATC